MKNYEPLKNQYRRNLLKKAIKTAGRVFEGQALDVAIEQETDAQTT